MIPETIIQNFIWVHVVTGTLALLAGTVALIVKKGGTWHKRSGKLFFWSMMVCGMVAILVSISPGHESVFLFCLGVFSLYLIISGYLALRYKKPSGQYLWDKVLAVIMLLVSIGMIYMSLSRGHINYVLLVFGLMGLNFGVGDMIKLRKPDQLKTEWLKIHLGKMTGGFIATVTAFIVANSVIPGMLGWFVPTLIGTPYIIYWNRKLKKK